MDLNQALLREGLFYFQELDPEAQLQKQAILMNGELLERNFLIWLGLLPWAIRTVKEPAE
ncbi:MAG: hypothetical protein H7222_09745 [Methylotenera sp.]|nr:hypothetical protein [Oligoflexia bacterium]